MIEETGVAGSEVETKDATTNQETTTEIKGIKGISKGKDQEAWKSIEVEAEVGVEATKKEESTRLEVPLTQVIADLYRQHNTIIPLTAPPPIPGRFLISSRFCTPPFHVSSRPSILLRTSSHLSTSLSPSLPLSHSRSFLHIFSRPRKSKFPNRPFCCPSISLHTLSPQELTQDY